MASALPNVGRYTGGALGGAVLGAIMAASLPQGASALGAADDAAAGFRISMFVAVGFLLVAALASTRMPRVVGPAAPASPGAPLTPPIVR